MVDDGIRSNEAWSQLLKVHLQLEMTRAQPDYVPGSVGRPRPAATAFVGSVV